MQNICLLAVLGYQGIVIKSTAAIFFRTADCAGAFVNVYIHSRETKKISMW